jgi:MSHA biogenesis protein MshO
MRRASERRASGERGFTLVEMIIAIVITGILVAIVSMFGRRQIDAYIDISNRAELSDAADTAVRRIARDLQAALPNSVRNDAAAFLELTPIVDAGRYRADIGGAVGDDLLDFASADNSFDVLGPPVTIAAGQQLVIFNLGQAGSDVYEGTSRRAATAGTNLSKVTFTGAQFPLASPQNRFQIVGTPVTYECSANAANPQLGVIRRHAGYGFQGVQPGSFGGPGVQTSILVGNVSACSFSYTPAVLQRNGLVVLRLTMTRNDESVRLLHQVDVLNTP